MDICDYILTIEQRALTNWEHSRFVCSQKNHYNTSMDLMLALYSFGGIILAGISVPLILHKIPPDGMYGIRAPALLNDPELWYRVNAYAGRRFMLVGLGTSLGAIILYFTSRPEVERYALSCLGLFLALCLWGGISSFLYLRSVEK